MPIWIKISFQNRKSPIIEHLEFFHDHSIIIITAVTAITSWLIIQNITTKITNRFSPERQEIEIFWTTIPAIILSFIALPSLKILYIIDEIPNPNLSLKVNGSQWYWSYEYPSIIKKETNNFISSIIPRNLITSNPVIIPLKIPTQILISSTDVLHSWTVPSLGIKADATPGRLNQTFFLISQPGIITGQCSEICGINHSFIPITLARTHHSEFLSQ
jgi:cytochrome c oxidase subunit 2